MKRNFALCLLLLLTGCSDARNVVLEEAPAEETNAYQIIEDTMESMGITGSIVEGNKSKEIEYDASLVTRNVDEYVEITTDDNDVYYGAIVDGEVVIWSPDDSNSFPDEMDGNVFIEVGVPDRFTNNISLILVDITSGDGTDITTYNTTEIVMTKESGYKTSLLLPNGAYTVYDYDLGSNDYYILHTPFTVSNNKQAVSFQVNSFES